METPRDVVALNNACLRLGEPIIDELNRILAHQLPDKWDANTVRHILELHSTFESKRDFILRGLSPADKEFILQKQGMPTIRFYYYDPRLYPVARAVYFMTYATPPGAVRLSHNA